MSDAYYQPPEPDPGIEWARDQLRYADDHIERMWQYVTSLAFPPEKIIAVGLEIYEASAQFRDTEAADYLSNALDDIA